MSSQRPPYESAPLPSPTSTKPRHFYFPPPRSEQEQSFQQQQQQMQAQHASSFQSSMQQQQWQQPPAMSGPSKQQSEATNDESRIHSNDPSSPFRRDFNLIAEAAKRAEMAVLVRDLDEVGL